MSPRARNSVLVPIDFSDASFEALQEALSLVDSPANVHAIHVLPDLESCKNGASFLGSPNHHDRLSRFRVRRMMTVSALSLSSPSEELHP